MRKQEPQHRLALTILFTAIVFCHILLTVLIVGVVLYLLDDWGVFVNAEQELLSIGDIILIYGIASLPVGGFMTYLISKILLRPVNTLVNRMNSLAAGNYKVRIDPGEFWGKHSTIREVTDSFNRMAQELEGRQILRSDFINNFSHEFKTPIVSIAGFAKLLRSGRLEQDQKEEYLQIIEEESLRLSQMATNVLNLTKVENQTVLSEISDFNLSEQIRSSILLLISKWEKKELEFILNFREYQVSANEELLKQVWINLLDNAIKFSPEGSTIEVNIRKGNGNILVTILNSGPDIPPEKQQKIFQKFYQADESHSTEGNGVGLAVVKKVIELHNGSVRVSCKFGISDFTVTMPQLL